MEGDFMVKYAKINGYKNLGECGMFTHLYQWMEEDKETPMIILLHAYECKPQMFKGYLFCKTEKYQDIPILNDEINELKTLLGEEIKQCSFKDFIKGTVLEECYKTFTSLSMKD
jgi:hypothetical protein